MIYISEDDAFLYDVIMEYMEIKNMRASAENGRVHAAIWCLLAQHTDHNRRH